MVFRSLEGAEQAAQGLLWLMALALPVLLLLSGAGGYWLSRRALAPIDRVIRTARAIRDGNLSQRIGLPHTSDELGRLVATLDEMLDRLEEAFARQRQFTSNASHELRTPVAVVRAQAEAALAEREPEAWLSALRVIRRESERMSAMLAQMLEVVLGDARGREGAREPIDLNALVEGTVASFQPLAEEAGVRLSAEAEPQPVVLHGDQSALTQALVNLVQNALAFTPAGGRVRITTRVDREGGVAVLSVSDTGVGIPEKDRPHIFERFYRGRLPRRDDVGAGRMRPAGGAGLGLSIVQQAVERFGGSIEVESAVGRGTTFTLRLPLEEARGGAGAPLPRGGSQSARRR
ncbi:MAG: HAMP domain-containing sensor histidine kinase [Bacillota bacterium]|nr:HAMP domain-containing sensor histidine kinase [Bacillota bacterium]